MPTKFYDKGMVSNTFYQPIQHCTPNSTAMSKIHKSQQMKLFSKSKHKTRKIHTQYPGDRHHENIIQHQELRGQLKPAMSKLQPTDEFSPAQEVGLKCIPKLCTKNIKLLKKKISTNSLVPCHLLYILNEL